MEGQSMTTERLEVIYDGDCPFCASYVGIVRLREAVGQVDLVDARSADPRVAEVQAMGFDLDEGMVVRHGDAVFYGDAAMRHLSILSAPGGVMNTALRVLFRAPRRAALLYPVLATGRRLTLRVLGRRKIADSQGRAPVGE
jgi:predicted DCC family thiol-disulfide oxidoreductase YuxK